MTGRNIQLLLEKTCLRHGTPVSCAEGEYLAFENDLPAELFFVSSGKLRLSSLSAQGREFLFGELGPGRLAGLAPIQTGAPYPYSIRAAAPGEIFKLSAATWADLLQNDRKLNDGVLHLLAQENTILARRLKSIVLLSVEKRLARYLLKRNSLEKKSPGDNSLTLHFSREDLSCILGTTRESISRALSLLSHQGAIAVSSRRLEIISPDLLAQCAATA